jgi:transcriptional regulator with XRE-family HTH domain
MATRNATKPDTSKPTQYEVAATFGANLKAERLKKGLTQAELAKGAGLFQQYVSLIELGKQNFTLDTAVALATVVDRDVRTLLASPRSQTTAR